MFKLLKNKFKNRKKWLPTVVVIGVLLLLFWYWNSQRVVLSHEQEVWLHALEWCESSGVPSKVNQKDLDGTPSYFAFQFKPGTFKMYGIKYGLLPADVTDEAVKAKLDDYLLQKKMVSLMMDDPAINWRREFPDCVRKLGRPPLGE